MLHEIDDGLRVCTSNVDRALLELMRHKLVLVTTPGDHGSGSTLNEREHEYESWLRTEEGQTCLAAHAMWCKPGWPNRVIQMVRVGLRSGASSREKASLNALWRMATTVFEAAGDGRAELEAFIKWLVTDEGQACAAAFGTWCKPTAVSGSAPSNAPPRAVALAAADLKGVLKDAAVCPGCLAPLDGVAALAGHAKACDAPLRRTKAQERQGGEPAKIYFLAGSLNEENAKHHHRLIDKVPDFKGFPVCDYHLPVRLPCCSELSPLNEAPNTYTRSSKSMVVKHYDDIALRNTSKPIRRKEDASVNAENAGTYMNYLSALSTNHQEDERVELWQAPDAPDLYDALIGYHRGACKYVLKQAALQTCKVKVKDFVFSHDYTCVLIAIPQRGSFPYSGQSDIETLFASMLVAYVDHETAAQGLDMPCAMRASFGYLSPTAGGLDMGVVRLSLGVGPREYLDAVARAIVRFLNDIMNATEYADTPLVDGQPDLTLHRWFAKALKLANTLCSVFGGQAEATKLALSGLYNGANGVLCAMMGAVLNRLGDGWALAQGAFTGSDVMTFPKLYQYVPLAEAGIAGPKVEGDSSFLALAKLIMARAHSPDADSAWEAPEIAFEGAQFLNDVWWSMLLSSRLMTWRSLAKLYGPRKARRADRRPVEVWGSDSEEEDDELYHLKLVTHGGMHAIRVALEFVLSNYDANVVYNVGMYYELPELYKAVRAVTQREVRLLPYKDSDDPPASSEVLIGDRNHCLKQKPQKAGRFDGIHNLESGWGASNVIVDVTSASVAEMNNLVRMHRRRLADGMPPACCLVLVSSGLKNEQTGEDINPYGTVRIFISKNYRVWLLKMLGGTKLSAGAEFPAETPVVSGLHHSVRRWHIFMGTVVTVKHIWGKEERDAKPPDLRW